MSWKVQLKANLLHVPAYKNRNQLLVTGTCKTSHAPCCDSLRQKSIPSAPDGSGSMDEAEREVTCGYDRLNGSAHSVAEFLG